MERILREKHLPLTKNFTLQSMREQTQRLRENVVQVQQQFNELMEQMTMAEVALAQLEAGVDHIDVKMWPRKQDCDD
jgi:uncharacterized protein YhaN